MSTNDKDARVRDTMTSLREIDVLMREQQAAIQDMQIAHENQLETLRRECHVGMADIMGWLRDDLHGLADEKMPSNLQAREDRSDVLQDVLLQANINLAQFRGHTYGEMLTWARAILDRVVIDRFRHHTAQKREIQKDGPYQGSEKLDGGDNASSVVRRKEELAAVMKSADSLPELQAIVIRMIHIEELSWDAVGRILGTSSNTARNRYGKAIKQLRDMHRESGDFGDE